MLISSKYLINKIATDFNLSDSDWNQTLGENGQVYRKIWHILEGV